MISKLFALKDRYYPEPRFRAARAWSNDELRKLSDLFWGDVVNVSGYMDSDKRGGEYRDYFPHATSYTVTNYLTKSGYGGDEILLNLEDELPGKLRHAFDVVFSHTTLEHIYDVQTACRNLCEMSREHVIIVVPFLQQLHYESHYEDYWRFTPFTLKRMFEQNGFEMVYCAGDPAPRRSVYILAVGARHPGQWKEEFDQEVFTRLGDRAF